jgi:hypothetical protein
VKKMTTEHRRITWLLVLVSALPGLASARQGRLIGKVVDSDGRPIPGVTVTTTSPEISDFRQVATTDAKGLFMVDFTRINIKYLYQPAAGSASRSSRRDRRGHRPPRARWSRHPPRRPPALRLDVEPGDRRRNAGPSREAKDGKAATKFRRPSYDPEAGGRPD